MNWFNSLISDGSAISSARFLNIFGAIVLSGVYIAGFITGKPIDINITTVLAAYFGGVYGVSKGFTVVKSYMDKRKNKDELITE